MNLFNGQQEDIQSQPAMQNISGNFMSSIMEKFGLNGKQAGGIAASLIPVILSKFVNRTNDPSDNSFNIQDIFNKLSNNGTSGIDVGGMLSKFGAGKGLDKDADGDVDFSDLTAAFSGSSQGAGNANNNAGILDKLKGMLGN